jgi:diaminohydroxyphosphoribosylaminopyrimidine deaminase/5-amino-6-(5-phosphoribosylamino)uracil reductase
MSNFTIQDRQFMARAIELAARGTYTTDPNPRVGCVLVRDGEVIGEGYHQRAGEGHAEVNALRAVGGHASGATAYVTLEPCSHYGRTPPCAEGLIKSGVVRVVAAMVDPNPEVAGRGLAMLNAAGIETSSGLLELQARDLNRGFLSRMERQRPYVRLKLAISADGRTAMASGESQWITGAQARADVQRLRARSSAILTGIGSILVDDSSLTVRSGELTDYVKPSFGNRQPLRVVLDSKGRISANAKILNQPGRTLVVTGPDVSLPECVEQCQMSLVDGQLDLSAVIKHLALNEACNEVLVECGAELAGAMISNNLVDEMVVYMAPKLMGNLARPMAALPFDFMNEAVELELKDLRQLGQDIRFTWAFKESR